MAVTTLDPNTALIVVDLQKGVMSPRVEPVLTQAVALLEAFRAHALPVILVNVAGGAPGRKEHAGGGQRSGDWTDLVPALNRQPSDHTVTKKTWGAFTGTDLQAHLQGLGVSQVVIAGVATSIGVESTARQAHEHGYNVTLAIDAMLDPSPDAHANSITRIFPRLGETGATAEIIELLGQGRG